MLNFIIKRHFYKLGKREIFENILPLKSETYFKNFIVKKQTFYLGIDPTASSLQIGNLFPLIALLRVWRSGHNIIALIGGATGRIGDPTGRTQDRIQIPDALINTNSGCVKNDIERIIKNFELYFWKKEELGSFKLLNNKDWYQDLNMLDFITDVLKHFRFHDVKNKRSFENRLAMENSMNMSEFLYPFLQAYDWLHLYKHHGCRVQIGGDDQQGNMQLGQILIDQSENAQVYGLTVPLFTVAGEKLGKSSAKSHLKLWLNPEMQSPYSLYYSIMHVSNGIIVNNGLLRRLTLLEDYEIDEIMNRHESNPNEHVLQTVLADQVLKLVHGQKVLTAVQCAHHLFSISAPELIREQLAPINDTGVILNNISSVPHISINSAHEPITINQLMDALSVPNMNNPPSSVKFNGENVIDLSQPLNSSVFQHRICGVLQIVGFVLLA